MKNVYKLNPGEILQFRYGTVNKWKYWDISEVYHRMQQDPVTDYEKAKTELKELLRKAVSSRMIADVPLGAFLSGGYDSSLMTAIAQEHSEKPVKTFSIGFHEKRYNEAVYAKKVAEFLGTDHTELYINEKEMYDLMEDLPKYYDEPFADSSQVATMMVSKLARQQVTVALSGDGGDEFFCGYNVYEKIHEAQMLDGAGALLHRVCHLPGIGALKAEDRLPFAVQVIAKNRPLETKSQFAYNKYIPITEKMLIGEQLPCHYPVESRYGVKKTGRYAECCLIWIRICPEIFFVRWTGLPCAIP